MDSNLLCVKQLSIAEFSETVNLGQEDLQTHLFIFFLSLECSLECAFRTLQNPVKPHFHWELEAVVCPFSATI